MLTLEQYEKGLMSMLDCDQDHKNSFENDEKIDQMENIKNRGLDFDLERQLDMLNGENEILRDDI